MSERERQRWQAQLEAATARGDRVAQTILRAHLAANHPEYVGTDAAQEALREAAELARVARRKAWSESELRAAWGDR